MNGMSVAGKAAVADTPMRLRRDVFDELTTEKNAKTVSAQARLTGVPERTLYRIRRGDPPSLTSALRIADSLGVPMSALFERVRAAA